MICTKFPCENSTYMGELSSATNPLSTAISGNLPPIHTPQNAAIPPPPFVSSPGPAHVQPSYQWDIAHGLHTNWASTVPRPP